MENDKNSHFSIWVEKNEENIKISKNTKVTGTFPLFRFIRIMKIPPSGFSKFNKMWKTQLSETYFRSEIDTFKQHYVGFPVSFDWLKQNKKQHPKLDASNCHVHERYFSTVEPPMSQNSQNFLFTRINFCTFVY